MTLYADIIVDISLEKLDQTFQYRIPESLEDELEPGDVVEFPFGKYNRLTRGYVLKITPDAECGTEKIKTIFSIVTKSCSSESKLITLALWIRDYYGSTTVQALRTVLPFRSKAPEKKKVHIVLSLPDDKAREQLEFYRRKHQTAKARLLEALIDEPVLPQEAVKGTLKITKPVLQKMEDEGVIRSESEQIYRTPALLKQLQQEMVQAAEDTGESSVAGFTLTDEQRNAVDTICGAMKKKYRTDVHTPVQGDQPAGCDEYLIYGVTGSGKTAVYMELIAEALRQGRQTILLIPEISLTYQNVVRFYHAFGDRISILHSRLTPSERYDQFERARSGDIDIMIGPRSALFTPFEHLGLIIIDEEHEQSYKSETAPRYDAREVARKRAMLEGALLVMGSATPSLESYHAAMQGSCHLLTMHQRTGKSRLPKVTVVDMRRELQDGNSSVLSLTLTEKIRKCLDSRLQCMLFINRRGYLGFVSCRSCGHVMKCPHCDVSLTLHQGDRLVCHYCGYEEKAVKKCPVCGSPFIGGFKAGTQQIEAIVSEKFPDARILRMDADTTRGRDGHAEILRAFGRHEADILIGTQMIVKGHDFPNVALVGAVAADLSLNVCDYRAAERTYQLLAQAAGRAGRAEVPGEVVIQTYQPEHYAITCAAAQRYEPFYEQEIEYRTLSGYPPAGCLLSVHCACEDKEKLETAVSYLGRFALSAAEKFHADVLGPADETISRINDIYRKVLYIRHDDERALTSVKNYMEQYIQMNRGFDNIKINFER